MAYTNVDDIKDRWLVSDPLPDDAKLETLIDEAEDIVLSAIPDLADRISDGRIPLVRLQRIVSRMVIRHIQNPTGVRQTQETTGPFTKGVTYGGDEPGSMYLTDDEKRQLLGKSSTSGRAFQIDTTPARRVRAYDAEI